TVLIVGIPLGALIQLVLIPLLFPKEVISAYNLDNFYVTGGITQFFCVAIMVVVSLYTRPRIAAEISGLTWTSKLLKLPESEPGRPWWQSVWLWWGIIATIYLVLYILWW